MDERGKKAHPEFQKLIESLKSGKMDLLDKLYQEKRSEFVRWMFSQFKLSKEDSLELFQAAILIIYENIMANKADEVVSSPGTYLFSIGRNLALKQFSSNERHLKHQNKIQWFLEDNDHQDEETEKLSQAAKEILAQMDEPCHSLLLLFYYEALGTEQIAQRLDYKNKDVVKSQKVRCLKYLKESLSKFLG